MTLAPEIIVTQYRFPMGQNYLNWTVKSANQSRPKGPMNQIDFRWEDLLEPTSQPSIYIYRYSCNSGDVVILLVWRSL